MVNEGFVFFDETSSTQYSNPFSIGGGIGSITISVKASSTVSLKFEGVVDLQDGSNYHPIKLVGLKDFKTYEEITESGLYILVTSGMQKVRGKLTTGLGATKVYGAGM